MSWLLNDNMNTLDKDKSRKGVKYDSAASTAMTAVALQDHLVRSLSIQDPFSKKKINHKLPVTSKHKNKPPPKVTECRQQKVAKEEKEYVLDPKHPPLTLAQKLGIVEAPDQGLSVKEWQAVKKQSNARNDSTQPCVICKDDFGIQQQVLLSCSHVFHRTCLEAYEKFSGRKCCPMCRKEQYQKRVIHEGAKEYRIKCAIKIQAAWRGYVAHSWYKNLRQTVPPNDPGLRKKFYEDKLQSINDRILCSTEANSQSVDHLMSEIDESIACSRSIMRQVGKDNFQCITEDEWEQIQLKAVERCILDCPICIMPLSQQGLYKDNGSTRPTVLLSCSHVFHVTCIMAFEEFTVNEQHVCPVCRSPYSKKTI